SVSPIVSIIGSPIIGIAKLEVSVNEFNISQNPYALVSPVRYESGIRAVIAPVIVCIPDESPYVRNFLNGNRQFHFIECNQILAGANIDISAIQLEGTVATCITVVGSPIVVLSDFEVTAKKINNCSPLIGGIIVSKRKVRTVITPIVISITNNAPGVWFNGIAIC